jgi:AcrR family transcriptional regulator
MARRPGSRNADYAQERDAILDRLKERIGHTGRYHLSLRELSQAAGVSPSTLRHYFGDRAGVLAATFERVHHAGLPFIAAAATEGHGPASESLAWFLDYLRFGWNLGVGKAHALGLTEGLGEPELGRAYLTHLLEPTLQSAEARIARHVAHGELAPCDVRHAALELLAPVVLALLHQQALCGDAVRPLDLDAFVADHLRRFLRAHAAGGPARLDPAAGPPAAASDR